MMERPCLVDGRPYDCGGLPDGLYVSQNIAVTGRCGLFVERHAEVLDHASRQLLGFGLCRSARNIGHDIERLLADNGYPADGLSYVTVRQYLSGELAIAANALFPYRERGLRVVFPRAAVVDYEIPFSEVRSSLSESAIEAARAVLRQQSPEVQTILRRNSRGEIVEADGAPLFLAVGGRIVAPEPSVPSAEFATAVEAVLAAGLSFETAVVDGDMLMAADELFFADHRGITAVASCGERHYMHLLAARVGNLYLK